MGSGRPASGLTTLSVGIGSDPSDISHSMIGRLTSATPRGIPPLRCAARRGQIAWEVCDEPALDLLKVRADCRHLLPHGAERLRHAVADRPDTPGRSGPVDKMASTLDRRAQRIESPDTHQSYYHERGDDREGHPKDQTRIDRGVLQRLDDDTDESNEEC